MKTKSKISAYILRGSMTALLLSYVIVALCSAINLPNNPPKIPAPQNNTAVRANAHQNQTLSFAGRVAYQRAIEDVYWRHRIWPDTNAGPKPSLDAVMSQAQIEKKVTDYLRNSRALEDYWQRPITAAQLQTEMERMASHTKQPEVLQELFEALGNDPFVIAECLAKPVLTERLIADLSAQHQTGRREHASSGTALHHYAFDGPGVVDSVGTANGTLLNGASVSAGQLHLDGVDDYVQFQEDVVPTVGDFSVAFFAQEVSPQADYAEIISQGFSVGPGFYVGYDPDHNFRIGDDLLFTGIPFPSDGFLHHYAVTAGSDTRLYIDGSLVATFGPISTDCWRNPYPVGPPVRPVRGVLQRQSR